MRSMDQLFMRSMDQLVEIDPSKKQNLFVTYTHDEVVKLFGVNKIQEIYDYGSAIITTSVNEPYKTIRNKLKELNIDIEIMISDLKISDEIVNNLMNLKRIPIEIIVKICEYLNPKTIGTIAC